MKEVPCWSARILYCYSEQKRPHLLHTCSKGVEARCLIALISPFFGKPLLSFITTCFRQKERTAIDVNHNHPTTKLRLAFTAQKLERVGDAA